MNTPAPQPPPSNPVRSNEVSIVVRDLHVDFEVFAQRRASVRGLFVEQHGQGRDVVHAVRGLNLVARRGDAIGVIGANGSGKSTLLAALAGLQPITSGEILVRSEPKLLGVGAVLLPMSTGRANVRLGCLALGMGADELDEAIERIIAFTELGPAIDRPLQTYSAGMRARLHFAISTAAQPDILLIDEALAVGDQAFRDKSRERIDGLLAGAGTLLLVSHVMSDIRTLCNRVIWVDRGVVRADGEVDEVVAAYQAEVNRARPAGAAAETPGWRLRRMLRASRRAPQHAASPRHRQAKLPRRDGTAERA